MQTRLTAILMLGLSCAGCVIQRTNTDCVPNFDLQVDDTLAIYLVDWFDRTTGFTSFKYGTDEYLLCLQPQEVGDTWCERWNLSFHASGPEPAPDVRTKPLQLGTTVRFDGSVEQLRPGYTMAVLAPKTYFRGRVNGRIVWLGQFELLHLMREHARFRSEYESVLASIGAFQMLDRYNDPNISLGRVGQWKCPESLDSSNR